MEESRDQEQDMLNRVLEQLGPMMDAASEIAPKIAKIYKRLYDSLIEEGFTPEQAITIVSNYKPGMGS